MTEIIEHGTGLIPFEQGDMVEQALARWDAYQELTRKLLDPTDYQATGQKRFKKKSAWRKYANAFHLSDRVVHEEIVRDDDGWPRYARVRVAAAYPDGRSAEADHECHITERCCPRSRGNPCSKSGWDKRHICCQAGCDGRTHWSHPGDIPATALTRAKNRAISDLIGAGEVSAEEMQGQSVEPAQPRAPATVPYDSETMRAQNEWDERNAQTADDEYLDDDGSTFTIPARESVPDASTIPICGCGERMEERRGVAQKTGNPWHGWFCTKRRAPSELAPPACKPRWIND
jgi:hypothetical protein